MHHDLWPLKYFQDLDGVSNAIADWFVDDTNIPLLTKFPLFVRQNRMSSSNMAPTYAKTFEPNGLAAVLQSQNPYRLKRHPSFRLKRASHQSFRLKRISGNGKNILLRVGRRSIKNKIWKTCRRMMKCLYTLYLNTKSFRCCNRILNVSDKEDHIAPPLQWKSYRRSKV